MHPTYSEENFHHICDSLAQKDADLKTIIDTYGYPPLWTRPNVFQTLILTILEQQVSLASAYAAYKKLKEKIGFVTPKKILALSAEELRSCYFSRQKIVYAKELATAIVNKKLSLKKLSLASDDEIRKTLTQIKGIGDWTVDVYLIHALHRTDLLPLGDVGLVTSLKEVKGLDKHATKADMLLNYNKPVMVSSTFGGYTPNYAVDENIKTYWSAKSGRSGEYFITDLGAASTIKSIQINYADQDVDSSFLGKINGIYHQYKLYSSNDGKTWKMLVDKSQNKTDVPHEYIELQTASSARFIKMENLHMPTGKFALSGFRVFGKGAGAAPDTVKHFIVLRGDSERRNAWLKWQLMNDADGYVIYSGIAPDKLYTSVMLYGVNEYYFRAMDKDKPYYFCIEAFNENGISQKSTVVKAE